MKFSISLFISYFGLMMPINPGEKFPVKVTVDFVVTKALVDLYSRLNDYLSNKSIDKLSKAGCPFLLFNLLAAKFLYYDPLHEV